jgi:hypothetical protein
MMTLEQAQETRNSVMWKWVCDEIQNRINAALNELKCCDMDDVEFIRNKIKTLEELSRLPDDVVEREESPS